MSALYVPGVATSFAPHNRLYELLDTSYFYKRGLFAFYRNTEFLFAQNS